MTSNTTTIIVSIASSTELHRDVTVPNVDYDNMPDIEEISQSYTRRLIPAIVVLGIFIVFGVIGNTLVCYIYGCRLRPSTQHFFIVCLAVFDLVSCSIGIPTEICDMVFYYTFHSVAACKLLRTINTSTTLGSTFTLVAIAVDRYRKLCKPNEPQMTHFHARMCLVIIFGFTIFFAWPSPVMYGISSVDVGIPNITGSDCTITDNFQETVFPEIYNLVLSCGFIVLVVSLIVLYTFILRSLRRHTRLLQKSGIVAMKVGMGTKTSDKTMPLNRVDSVKSERLRSVGSDETMEMYLPYEDDTLENAEAEQPSQMPIINSSEFRSSYSLEDIMQYDKGYNNRESKKRKRHLDATSSEQDDATMDSNKWLQILSPQKASGLQTERWQSEIKYRPTKSVGDSQNESTEQEVQFKNSNRTGEKCDEDHTIKSSKLSSNDWEYTDSPKTSTSNHQVSFSNFPQNSGTDTLSSPSQQEKGFHPPSFSTPKGQLSTNTDTKSKEDKNSPKKFSLTIDSPTSPFATTKPARKITTKTTTIAFLVTVVFILSYLPHLLFQVVKFLRSDDNDEESLLLANNLIVRSYFINSVANPIIYGVLNVKFRDEVKLLGRRICC